MDRFERLTRMLAGILDRRQLGAAATGALLALGLTPPVEGKRKKRKKKKHKKKGEPPGCPNGCGFNEFCSGGVCVPACIGGAQPCPGATGGCCFVGTVCMEGECVVPCPDGRAHCGGQCCGAAQDCVDDVCGSCEEDGCYALEVEWSGSDVPGGAFDQPNDIAVDADDNVYVVDAGNGRIQKFDNNGNDLTMWNASGYGVGVDVDYYVYVANDGFVRQFDTSGLPIVPFTGGLNGAADAAVDSEGNVYVINSIGDNVVKFNFVGDVVDQWTANGGSFNFADGIAVDLSDDTVYVADTFNHRIQKFTSDGDFLLEWGSSGTDDGEFNQPNGIAVDQDGFVYVADFGNDRIQIFDSDGSYVAKFRGSFDGDGILNGPVGVAVDSNFNVFVADFLNNRVLKFAPHLLAGRRAAKGKRAAGSRRGRQSAKRRTRRADHRRRRH